MFLWLVFLNTCCFLNIWDVWLINLSFSEGVKATNQFSFSAQIVEFTLRQTVGNSFISKPSWIALVIRAGTVSHQMVRDLKEAGSQPLQIPAIQLGDLARGWRCSSQLQMSLIGCSALPTILTETFFHHSLQSAFTITSCYTPTKKDHYTVCSLKPPLQVFAVLLS